MEKPIRNNANIRVIVPQYVNLRVYVHHFEVSVTLNVDEFTAHFITVKQPALGGNCKVYTFQKATKKGPRSYVTVWRDYTDLNMIRYATSVIAASDLKTLKILIREAKINKLEREIQDLF